MPESIWPSQRKQKGNLVMKSRAIAVWLGIAAVLVFGTAMASSARAQAQRKEEASSAKVWGYYWIVGTERGGDGKVLVEVIVRLINRSGENYSLNSMQMLGPCGSFHTGKAVEGTAAGLTIGVTTVKEQFTVFRRRCRQVARGNPVGAGAFGGRR